MNILYIHGFGSKYDPEHEKIKTLESLGTVCGINVDYTRGFRTVFETVMGVVLTDNIDLIVGTSMGGYMAAHVGAESGTPFVALNPATCPSDSLLKWVGNNVAHDGTEFSLNEATAANYPDIIEEGCGLVIVESGDEVISSSETIAKLTNVFQVELFAGGCHRFAHMEKALPLIEAHILHAETSYGLD